jgi:hypothetical protein
MKDKMKTTIIILIIFWAMLFTHKSHAQEAAPGIFVYDYNPDLRIDNIFDTIKIDINQNGNIDILFFLVPFSGGTYSLVRPLTCEFTYMHDVTSDSLNNDSLIWQASQVDWGFNVVTGIVLKFSEGDSLYYGWISGSSFYDRTGSKPIHVITIDKFAYCNIPNYPLVWGQTYITGIASHTIAPGIKVTRHGQGESLSVLSENKDIKNVQVINLNGAIIKNEGFMPAKNVAVSTSGLNRGTYIVVATFTDNTRSTAKTAW